MFSRSRFIRFFLLPVALVGSLGAGVAFAGGGFGGPGFHGPHHGPPPMVLAHLERVADELGLTEDQRTEIRSILEDGRARGEELRAQHDELRDEGIALFSAAELDVDAIEAHRQKMLDLADQGSQIMVDTLISASSVLTADQRVQLADKAEQFHEDGGVRGRLHQRLGREHFRGDRPFETQR